jgi:hypothetical protein
MTLQGTVQDKVPGSRIHGNPQSTLLIEPAF